PCHGRQRSCLIRSARTVPSRSCTPLTSTSVPFRYERQLPRSNRVRPSATTERLRRRNRMSGQDPVRFPISPRSSMRSPSSSSSSSSWPRSGGPTDGGGRGVGGPELVGGGGGFGFSGGAGGPGFPGGAGGFGLSGGVGGFGFA